MLFDTFVVCSKDNTACDIEHSFSYNACMISHSQLVHVCAIFIDILDSENCGIVEFITRGHLRVER